MRPTHLLCGVALAGALLTTGCGSDREREQFSTAQVAEFFHSVTGDSLQAQPGDELDALSIERGDSGRYGSFYIVVMRKPDDEDFYKIEDALPLMADARGVYWHKDGPSWTAMKRYGNVVLAWDADQRELDDRFERLHTVLTGLGKPAGADPRQARRQAAPAARQRVVRPRAAPDAAEPRSAADAGPDRTGRDPAATTTGSSAAPRAASCSSPSSSRTSATSRCAGSTTPACRWATRSTSRTARRPSP